MVPVLVEDVVLAATVNATAPGPVPLVPELMVIHAALLDAVHAQPEVVDTWTLPVPPEAAK